MGQQGGPGAFPLSAVARRSTLPRGRLRALLWPGVAATVAFVILVGLGSWQLSRMAWKSDLLARIGARAKTPAADLLTALSTPAGDGIAGQEYRRVTARGTYRAGDEARVLETWSAEGGDPVLGYDLLTPLTLADGRVIIVDRGFVPRELADTPAMAPPNGPVAVTGLLRAPELRRGIAGLVLPADEPARNLFYARDPLAIASAKGIAPVVPLRLDAERTGEGWPRGGRSRLDLPNEHLNYAITWFALAAGLVGVFGTYAAQVLGTRSPRA